jgi:hypothetical protein
MKLLRITLNPEHQSGNEPGQYFTMSIVVPDKATELDIESEIYKNVRWTVEDEELLPVAG